MGVDTLVSVDKEDIYLAVLSPDGTPQWAISFGGTSHQQLSDIDVDASGNIVLCGLAEAGEVIVQVYDARGRLVRALNAGWKSADEHDMVWDGQDDSGRALASGVYFYRMSGVAMSSALRMVLVS